MTETNLTQLDNQALDDLSLFFDLLAKFDFEDNNNSKLVVVSNSLVSAPRELEMDTNSKK